MIRKIYELSSIPVFMYIDAEAGIRDMFPIGTKFPNQMAIGATHDARYAYLVGKAVAKEASMLGFSIVANPVLDINSNPDNPIIGTRSFGDRADFVIEFGLEYIKGMQEERVIPTAKHFPGHGDTSVDSHRSMPVVDHPLNYLEEVELKPFKIAVENGVKGIMTAHIYYPAIQGKEEEDLPATMSKTILTDMLRNEWGFDGMVVSDSLTMKAIKDIYGIGDAAIMAFNAGNDLILQDYNSDPIITYNTLYEAVESGEISSERLDTAIERIFALKEWAGLYEKEAPTLDVIEKLDNYKEHQDLAKEVARHSVTVLEKTTIPFDTDKKRVLIVTRSDEEVEAAEDMTTLVYQKYNYLHDKMRVYDPSVELYTIGESPTNEEIHMVMEGCRDADEIVFGTFIRILSYKEGSGTVPKSQLALIENLIGTGKPVTMMVIGNPYVLGKIPLTSNTICAYSDDENSIDAVVDVLYGKAPSLGRLPVTVSDRYTFGYGL